MTVVTPHHHDDPQLAKPHPVGSHSGHKRIPPAWASSLGTVIFLFGILLTATHATEWMKQAVIATSTPSSQQLPAPDCPADELEEEGLSLAECEHLVSRIQGLVLSSPEWFGGFQRSLSAAGTLLAIISIVMGAAVVDGRSWAPRAATVTLALLVAIDSVAFIAVVNAGPIIRGEYLWSILLWLALHLAMTVALVAGRHNECRA